MSEYTVGTHQVPFVTTNAAGCDSTVTLNLTVNKMATLEVPVELEFCVGGSETYRGVEYTEAGTFPVQAIGATRDTIYNVTVTILQPTFGTDSKTIVYGAQESWNGIDLSEYTVGTHQVPFVTTNAAGCDSTVTLNLTVNKMATLEVPVELEFCVGGSETYRGVEYTEAGTFNVPAEGATRDTVYVVTVNVLQPTTGTDTKTIVYGAQETWNGIDLSERTVGQHEIPFTTTNLAGCDSTVTLTLTVTKQNVVEVPVMLRFCEGDSVEYRGTTYNVEGIFPVYVEGEICDTVYNVAVDVLKLVNEVNEISAQTGETIDFKEAGWLLRGETLVGRTYLVTKADTADLWFVRYTQTDEGCSATYRYDVDVEICYPFESEYVVEFCAGDSVEYLGQWFSEAGEYTVLVEDAVRDTLVYVEAIVLPIPEPMVLLDTVLSGHDIVLPEGEWVIGEETVSGTYPTIQSAETAELVFTQYNEKYEGCGDPLIYLVVTVESNHEGVENVFVGGKAEKFFREGVLYIRRGDRLFTAEGREVK